MEQVRSARKFGVWVMLLTLLFRVFELGLPQRALAYASNPIQKETERAVRSFSFPFPVESSPPMDYSPKPLQPTFTGEQAQSVETENSSRETPDYEALMAAPLDWQLEDSSPRVLILHTHTTESYEKREADYQETAAYRTLEEQYNMLAIGDRLTQLLEAEGIRVIHDREFHDYPAYSTAYTHARKSIQQQLKEHPSIQLVLDLHRDAADAQGSQLCTQLAGTDWAQLMLVLGVGNSGLPNPRWEDNLSLALKLQATLQQQCPGICRPISLRAQRFNQDLAPYSLLVEVGAAGDSREAALCAAEELARALVALKHGTL